MPPNQGLTSTAHGSPNCRAAPRANAICSWAFQLTISVATTDKSPIAAANAPKNMLPLSSSTFGSLPPAVAMAILQRQ